MAKRIITEEDILASVARGDKVLSAPQDQCIITAQAQDKATELGLHLDDNIHAITPDEEIKPSRGSTASPADSSLLDNIVGKVVERMREVLPSDLDTSDVALLVRDAVAARLATGVAGQGKNVSGGNDSGVIFIDNESLLKKTISPDIKEKVLLAEAIGRPGNSKLAAGYLLWEELSFDHCVQSPEIIVIIEGELNFEVNGRTIVAKSGDMAYLPAGACVNLSAPARVKLICVNTLA